MRTVRADFAALGWPAGALDLLWSQRAAYHLTFAGALRAWRPLPAAVRRLVEQLLFYVLRAV